MMFSSLSGGFLEDKMVEIKSRHIVLKISETGAEIKSLICDGEARIFEGDEKIWNGSAPILFPICSGLRDGEYFYEGKRYTLPKHGYANFSVFEVESTTDCSATFLLRSNEKSREIYPFDYELRVSYRLDARTLYVNYEVKNLTDGDMYFSIGSHEAYLCSEGIEEYDVVFPVAETLETTLIDENGFGYDKKNVITDSNILPLKNEYFEYDALIFENMRSREALIKHRYSDKAVRVKFPDTSLILLWTKPGAPYICLEPWCGYPDRFDADKNFATKEGIIKIEKGGLWEKEHSIEFIG